MTKIKDKFRLYMILTFIILTLFNYINCNFMHIYYVILTENQILYIYSSLAQIIGALLGLTIAGYSIIDSKIKSLGDEDTTITDYTNELRQEYFISLLCIIILSIINILFCLIVLSIYNNQLYTCLDFFMTETITIFIFIMLFTINFVCYLNPSKIQKKGSTEKKEIEKEYSSSSPEKTDTFSPFVTYYNLLERLIKTYACDLINSKPAILKIQIFEALDILLQHEIINRKIYNRINELRRYRNALVHSLDTDKTVDNIIYHDLEKIYKLLQDIYDNRSNENLVLESKQKLYEYSHKLGYGNVENKILEILSTHEASTIEIAECLNISRSYVSKKLQTLQKLNLIERIDAGRQPKWKLNDSAK